jgi:hypothetical protein
VANDLHPFENRYKKPISPHQNASGHGNAILLIIVRRLFDSYRQPPFNNMGATVANNRAHQA